MPINKDEKSKYYLPKKSGAASVNQSFAVGGLLVFFCAIEMDFNEVLKTLEHYWVKCIDVQKEYIKK